MQFELSGDDLFHRPNLAGFTQPVKSMGCVNGFSLRGRAAVYSSPWLEACLLYTFNISEGEVTSDADWSA
jgi:hypothetical protein